MTVVLYRRGPRRAGPELPSGELQLQEPPTLPDQQSGMSNMMMYAPMALSSMAMVLLFLRPGESGQALTYVAVGVMAVSGVGMLVSQLLRTSGDRKRQIRNERADYLRYLGQVRRRARDSVVNQQRALLWRHPDPAALRSMVRSSRLWERRVTHPDFGEVRIAVGEQRLGTVLASPSTKPVTDLEPLSAHALRRFIRAYATVPDQPIAVYLRAYARIVVAGDHDAIRAMARAVLAQLATLHAPDDLRIAVVGKPEERAEWDWVKWLPHAQHPVDTDAAGPVRMVVTSVGALESTLGAEFAGRPPFDPDAVPTRDEPYTVVVVDNGDPVPYNHRVTGTGYRNAVVLDLAGAIPFTSGRNTLLLRVDEGSVQIVEPDRTDKDAPRAIGRPDQLGPAGARAVAALIAPYRLQLSTESAEPLTANVQLTTLLGIGDLHTADVQDLWRDRGPQGRLKVPLGVAADNSPIELDLKESAQGGMGPHGMLIGATGSGKSELLRTLVLALALRHSSEILNFVLVDFKGGATFLGLDRLPHTSAVITNLEDEGALVGRMQDALHGELVRRQELLRSAGNYSSALEYERARASGTPLAPLPTLLVVVDEFSELLAAHREFMDLFVMIGRLGRSLGVHLLLASQRLDEGRTHQLESHLSYRIGLRTFSAMESRGVLGVPDAYQLPSAPGNGFLKTDTATLTRFKAAYVSGAYRARDRRVRQAAIAGQIVPYTSEHVAPREAPVPQPAPEPEGAGPSLLELAVQRLHGAGTPAQQVWLPPLDTPPTIDALLPPLLPDPERGLTAAGWTGQRRLTAPVGVLDRPFHHRRDLLIADLSGGGGHVGIVGGPQSGKSTMIRTLITSLALTHTPREVQFYCLDFGGGTLSTLAGLPHVGSVTGRLDIERLNRTIIEVDGVISRREREFAARGIDSMETLRQARAAGVADDDPFGDVFLVIDGWGTIRQDFPDLVQALGLTAARGLSYGVHLIIGANRWGELPSQLRDQLGTRFELRLGDPVESHLSMRVAATVPRAPGRGLTDEELHFLSALPRIDGVESTTDLAEAVTTMAETVASLWSGPPAPAVRMLPTELAADGMPAPEGDLRVALGIDEHQLAPFWHDFEQSPHLLVVGDVESGKTNLLRLVAHAVTKRFTPAEAKILLVDYRRELFDSVPEEYRLGYAVSLEVVRQMVDGAARAMAERLPPADLPPDRLRQRDWYTGPRLYLLVDDYDLVASTPMANPIGQLLDHLGQSTEIGLHLVVARSATGISRGIGDPLLRRMQEVNTPVALLSCPPSEGRIFNDIRPRTLPPGRALYLTRRTTTQIQTALTS